MFVDVEVVAVTVLVDMDWKGAGRFGKGVVDMGLKGYSCIAAGAVVALMGRKSVHNLMSIPHEPVSLVGRMGTKEVLVVVGDMKRM